MKMYFDIKVEDTNNLKEVVGEMEKYYLAMKLRECNNSKRELAITLKIDRKTLYNKMKKYNLID